MKLTKEQIESNNRIPTSEILTDINDTEREIKDFQDEKDILMRSPTDNKVRIYMLEGKILKREEFIEKLNLILGYRDFLKVRERKLLNHKDKGKHE